MADGVFRPKPLKMDRPKRGESQLGTGLKFGKKRRLKDLRVITSYKRQHPTCEGCQKEKTDDAHHLVSRQMFGPDAPDNLLALGRKCHRAWADVNRTRRQWLRERTSLMTDDAIAKVKRALRMIEGSADGR